MPDPHPCDRQVHLQTWPCVPGEQKNRSTLRATGPETKRTFFTIVMPVLHLWPGTPVLRPLSLHPVAIAHWYLALALGCSKAQHLPLLLLCGSLAGRQGRVWAGSQSQEHVQAHRPGALALRNGALFFSSGRTISSGGPCVEMGSGEGGVEAGGRKGSRGACC